jgi:hypothetical protein
MMRQAFPALLSFGRAIGLISEVFLDIGRNREYRALAVS